MSLTDPLFLLPITITLPTSGDLLAVLDGVGTTQIPVSAGTFYWENDEGEAGSFNEHIADALVAAYGGSWNISILDGILSIDYTGASVPTDIVFNDVTILSAHDFGDSLTVGDSSIFLTSKSWEGSYQVRGMWDPDEYVIDDRVIPHAKAVVAMSPFDGSAVIDDYNEWNSRRIILEAVDGARVFQWATNDAGFAGAAGVSTSEAWVALESMWRECRQGPGSAGTPLTLRYVPDKATWVAGNTVYHNIMWQDQAQLSELEAVAPILMEQPLLYRVTLQCKDLGTGS